MSKSIWRFNLFKFSLRSLSGTDEVVTRRELQELLWQGDTYVDFDNGLNHAISKIRRALDDSASKPRFVETLPRRGYRFVAPVETAASMPGPDPLRVLRRWVRYTGIGLTASFLALALYYWIGGEDAPVRAGTVNLDRPAPTYRYRPLTDGDPGISREPSISKDGSMIAYSSNRAGKGDNFDIWVRQVAGGEPWRITSHKAYDRRPSMSPGRHAGRFRVRPTWWRHLREADFRRLYPAYWLPKGHYPQVSSDGEWVAYADRDPQYLMVGSRPWLGISHLHHTDAWRRAAQTRNRNRNGGLSDVVSRLQTHLVSRGA